MTKTQTVAFICKACNGTGKSRYYEYRDCEICDGRGTILTTLTKATNVRH